MILSIRKFEYEELKSQLQPEDAVVVLSCNNCAKKCVGLGGRPGLKALSDKLEGDGFTVVRELVGIGCSVDLVRKRGKEPATAQAFADADVLIPLACEDGEAAAAWAFPDKRLIRVTKTLGCGWGSPTAGVHLSEVIDGVELDCPAPMGITLQEAAAQLGLPYGAF